ncbi:MAG: DMT family transporter [Steroidobacteraceae bacterium]
MRATRVGHYDISWSLYLRLAAVPAIWGGTFTAGKILAETLPPALASLLRFLIASLALLVASRWLEGPLPRLDRRQWWVVLGLGCSGILVYNLLFISALALMPASRASLIVALNPVVTIALTGWLFGERLTALRWSGVGLALCGVWIVVSGGHLLDPLPGAIGPGEAMMFGAVLAWAAYTLLGRTALAGLSPLAASTYASLVGTGMLSIAAIPDLLEFQPGMLTPEVLLAGAYLGILGTAVAFVWYYQAVQRLGPARTVVFNNLVPVFGATFAVLWLGEPVTWPLLVGGLLAVGGVGLVSRA